MQTQSLGGVCTKLTVDQNKSKHLSSPTRRFRCTFDESQDFFLPESVLVNISRNLEKHCFVFWWAGPKLCKNNSKHCFRRLHWTFGLDQYQKKIHHGLLTVSCVTSVKKYQHATRQKKLLSKHSCKSILTPNKNIPKNIQKRLVSSHFLP